MDENSKKSHTDSLEPIVTEHSLIAKHTLAWFQESNWSKSAFACERLVPALEKAGLTGLDKLSTLHQLELWRDRSRKRVGRILAMESDFPLAWKWIWVEMMDDPYRTKCRQDLLALAGTLDTPMPQTTRERMPCPSRIGEILKQVGEAVSASGPAQDGSWDPSDDPKTTQVYADEILDVYEAVAAELQAIERGTGITPTRYQLARQHNEFS